MKKPQSKGAGIRPRPKELKRLSLRMIGHKFRNHDSGSIIPLAQTVIQKKTGRAGQLLLGRPRGALVRPSLSETDLWIDRHPNLEGIRGNQKYPDRA